MERQIFDKLSAINHLKANQISSWLIAQEKVVNALASNKTLQNQTALFLKQRSLMQKEIEKELLYSFQRLSSYESITLVSPKNEVLLHVGKDLLVTNDSASLIHQSKTDNAVKHGDIMLSNDGESYLNFVIPIRHESQANNPLIAYLIIHINTNKYLFPYLEYWPNLSATGETLLVRKKNNRVEFLSPLRHSPVNGLLHGKAYSMTNHNLPAMVAIEKQKTGSLVGKDYRDVKVFASFEPVPNTSWMLVSKVDVKEASVALNDLIFLLSMIGLFAAFILGLLLMALFKKHLRTLELEAIAEKKQSEYAISNFYELPFIGMAILEPNSQKWVRFNNSFSKLLGYSSEELMMMDINDILQQEDYDKFISELTHLNDTEHQGFTLNALLRHKNGTTLSVILNVKYVPRQNDSSEFLLVTVQDVTELMLVSEQYLNYQGHLKTLIQTIPDLVWLKDNKGGYLSCNTMFERFFGAKEINIIGKTDYDFIDKDIADNFRKNDLVAMKKNGSTENEEWLNFADKSYQGLFATIKTPMKDESGQVIGVLGISRDITVRKKALEKLERLTQLYSAMNQVNEAIMRCDNEKELFEQICRVVVEIGGMKMAWIGMVDSESKQVSPIASHGTGIEYLENINISTDKDTLVGIGPVGTAIRDKSPYWCQDFKNDLNMIAWHERGEQFGWQSLASLPLYQNNQVVGALSIYSDVLHAFNKTEKELLSDIANNISFALNAFVRERAKKESELARDEILTRLTKLAGRLPGMVYQFRLKPDGSMSFPFASEAISTIYRLNPEDVFEDASVVKTRIYEEDIQDLFESIEESAKNLTLWKKEYRVKFDDGCVRWLSGNAVPEKESDGSILWHGFLTDITEAKAIEDKVKLASKVFEQSNEGIMITDANQKILLVNKAFEKITGYNQQDALGMRPSMLHSGRNTPEFYQDLWKSIDQKGYWHGEIWNKRKTGEIYPEWLSISRGEDKQGQVTEYVGIFSDISMNKENEERIQYLAHYDPLTNLVNRQLLMDRLKYAISTAKRNQSLLSLLFIDLDHFKNVNDTLGHPIGDKLLIEISKRMLSVLREVDTLSRHGGDEFVALLPDVGEENAAHVAEKIVHAISQKLQIDAYELFITPSIGIAVYPQDGEDMPTLLKNADAAMYQAKEDGRNVFRFYTDSMQVRALRVSVIENALRTALEKNEITLNYQPQLSAKTGEVLGAEALIRWTHPELGIVSPAEFIPIAEQSGQILKLSDWVLRQAVEQLKQFLNQGFSDFVMAINLSAVDFQQSTLPQQIVGLLEELQVAPNLLEVELTESVAMANPDSAVEMINNLSDTGINVAIDDFGTGYSSLSYLKRFHVNKVKIDQSFVRELNNNEEDRAIIKAIINLAKNLGLKTIAEGVETVEQLSYLQKEGCDEIQGYFYSKPLSANEFSRYLTSHKT
ncbi:hypothetical protein JCM30760_12420 [Thiomicrorhabdus hydrogeniphila]